MVFVYPFLTVGVVAMALFPGFFHLPPSVGEWLMFIFFPLAIGGLVLGGFFHTPVEHYDRDENDDEW